MSKSSKADKVGTIVGLISSILGLIITAQPIADYADKFVTAHTTGDGKVKIPDLYKTGFQIDISQAEQLLSILEFNFVFSKLSINEANAKYRNCIPNQVVSTNPRRGTKVVKGSAICVKYITEDVINQSQLIFEKQEQARQEKREKNKETIQSFKNNTTTKIKSLVTKKSRENDD